MKKYLLALIALVPILLLAASGTITVTTPYPIALSSSAAATDSIPGSGKIGVISGSITNQNLPMFSGTSGLIADSGTSSIQIVIGPNSSSDGEVALYSLGTGKILKNSGVLISGAKVLTGLNSVSNVTIGSPTAAAGTFTNLTANTSLTMPDGSTLITAGNHSTTFTTTGTTSVTFPTSGTLATTGNLAAYLPLAGGALTGLVTTNNQFQFVPATVSTTMSQSGILATIVGANSTYNGAYVVPASGSPFTIVNYQGTTTVPTTVSQTISSGTACTVYLFNSTPIDINSGLGLLQAFKATQYLTLGAIGTFTTIDGNGAAYGSFVSSNVANLPNNSSNQTASQSGTTVTGVGTSWDSTYKGHLIRFSTGSVAWITAVGSSTSMTVTPSQTVTSTTFDIPGKTNGVESTSMDGLGNFGTSNAYVNSSLVMPAGSTLTLGTIGTGVWQGSVIGSTYGGSGVASPTAHGILVAEGSSAFTPLTATNGQVLVGSTGSDPVAATIGGTQGVTWTTGAGTLSAGLSGVPNSALANSSVTLTAGTNISISGGSLSLGGSATINVAAPFSATTLTSNGLLIGNGTSNISGITACTNGQVPVGSTAAAPACATVGSANGLTWTTGANSLSIGITAGGIANASLTNSSVTVTAGAGLTGGGAVSLGSSTTISLNTSNITTWSTVSTTSQSMAVGNGYFANNSSLVTFTLPTSCTPGDKMIVDGQGAGGWKIAQNVTQVIHLGSSTTTSGTSGFLSSTNQWDSVTLRCILLNTAWTVESVIGNILVN